MPLKKKGVTALICLILIVLIPLLRFVPQVTEGTYSRFIYVIPATIFQYLWGWIPFSIGDLFYTAVTIAGIITAMKIIVSLFKKDWKKAIRLFLNGFLAFEFFIFLFYVFWGFNYFRQPASVRLNLPDIPYSIDQLKSITGSLIDSANFYRSSLSDADLRKSDREIFSVSEKAIKTLAAVSPDYKVYHPVIKKSLLTPLMNYMATSGYYNPFTAEAQLNDQMPVFLKPFVACHEMSHQAGFNREDEANFAGFVAGTSSGDRFLKYSSYYVGVQEFMIEMRRQDTVAYNSLKKNISPKVLEDFKTDYDYWMKFQGDINRYTGLFYDHFLKVNNQKEGLKTYNRMIKLVMASKLKRKNS